MRQRSSTRDARGETSARLPGRARSGSRARSAKRRDSKDTPAGESSSGSGERESASSTTQAVGGFGVASVPATGCFARGERSVGVTRKAYKPAPVRSSHLRAGSTSDEIPRELAHLVTGGPTTGLLLARERVQSWCEWRKPVAPGSIRQPSQGGERTTRLSSARGSVASLPRKGWGLVDGSTNERLRGPAVVGPLRGR